MTRMGFTRTIVFGFAAALTLVFAQHLAADWLGTGTVLVGHAAACLVAYTSLLGSTRRDALRNAGFTFIGAVGVLVLVGHTTAVWIGFAFVLGLVRSGLGGSMLPARALLIESTLLVSGFALALWISNPSWVGQALGLWGFVLVQSLYFLIPAGDQRHRGIARDRFDHAIEQIHLLLEEL